jgi:hypothetical protein
MKQHLLWIISVLTGASFGRPIPDKSFASNLAFANDGTFRITIFEDLHYGEGEDNRKFYFGIVDLPAIVISG